MRLSFSTLWVIGLFCFLSLLISVSRDFKSSSTINETEVALTNATANKLEVTSISPDKKYYRNRWFRLEPFSGLDEDTAYVNNITVHIVKADNDSFKVTMMKIANGRNRRSADTLAAMIDFNVVQKDSFLVLDKGIPINRTDKFRNQRIILTVYVPVGKQIRIDRNIGWGNDVQFSGPWNEDWDIDFDGLEHGWDEGVDYIMQADGLFTLDGNPADTWKNGDKVKHKKAKTTIIKDTDGDDVQVEKTNADNNNNQTGNYRYNDKKPTVIDTVKKKIQPVEKKVKDTTKTTEPQPTAYNSGTGTLSTYNPMLLMD
jgi:hypothetical protein